MDGHYQNGGLALGIGGGYAYDLGAAELGGGFDFFTVPDASRKVYLPYLAARLHLGVSSRTELGVSLRAGLLWETMADVPDDNNPQSRRTHVWFGGHGALSPDVRYWFTPKIAVDFGANLIFGGGSDQGEIEGYYLSDGATFIYGGLVAKFMYAP